MEPGKDQRKRGEGGSEAAKAKRRQERRDQEWAKDRANSPGEIQETHSGCGVRGRQLRGAKV